MIFGSVCSGIEAASVAWGPLGWRCAFTSEIDKFPAAVLRHRFPDTPNYGDMTKFKEWPDAAIDVLVGGTPCQSFSVAGLRKGLDDPRGNLMLTFLGLARRYRPGWIVWENVPGVLSSNQGRDFATFLEGLGECGYGFAYRVFDAQYFGVPQRRRRVFVVGHSGDWRPAAAVLLESASLSGDPAPRRETGQGIAALTANGVGTCGADDNQGQAGHLIAVDYTNGHLDDISGTLEAAQSRGNRGQGVIAQPIAPPVTGNQYGDHESREGLLVAHALPSEGFDASEDGTGRGTPIVPVAFSCKDHGADAGDTAPCLRAMGHDGSHANSGWPVAVAFDMRGRDGGSMMEGPHDTANIRASNGGSSRSYIAQPMAVRRLTPRECERLQGFPDDWTLIPYRGKPAAACPDGPRYKALGNSMAVPVMAWIGARIDLFEREVRPLTGGITP
jgi:DNA (cytosine-5)-methyltransferase 1